MNITLKNISKRFDDKQVLNKFCAEFPETQTTVIMGKSGCGKTTLLNIIMGLQKADEGEVTGVPERMAAVFQEDRLCETYSVLSNIKMVSATAVDKEEILRSLERVGMPQEALTQVSELSGGMKRRVAILRALLADATLLIMDEPLKGLDEATRDGMIEYMKEMMKDKTVIIVTHDPMEAKMFGGRVIQMSQEAKE